MLQSIVTIAVTLIATSLLAPLGPFAPVVGAMVGNAAGQGFGLATGIQTGGFSWKAVAESGISALFAPPGTGSFVGDVVAGAVSNVVTQGVEIAVGLEHKFDWAGVAVAGLSNGVSRGLSGAFHAPESFGADVGQRLVRGAASLVIAAGTRSLIEGTDFGDNIRAALPSVIAQSAVDFASDIASGNTDYAANRAAGEARRAHAHGDSGGFSSEAHQLPAAGSGAAGAPVAGLGGGSSKYTLTGPKGMTIRRSDPLERMLGFDSNLVAEPGNPLGGGQSTGTIDPRFFNAPDPLLMRSPNTDQSADDQKADGPDIVITGRPMTEQQKKDYDAKHGFFWHFGNLLAGRNWDGTKPKPRVRAEVSVIASLTNFFRPSTRAEIARVTVGKPLDAPFNASQPSTVRSWVLQRRFADNVSGLVTSTLGKGTAFDRYVTTPVGNALGTVARYTTGPGTPVDTLINKPFYATTDLIGRTPLGDPGTIMTLESNGYTAPLGAAGASVRWLNALRADSLAAERTFLSVDEFAALPKTGTIEPKLIRFSQDSAGATFKAPFGSVDDFATGLSKKSIDPLSVPPVRIAEKGGMIFTLDNRRLYAFQQAGRDIPYTKLDAIPKRELFKFTTQNNGKSILIRRGK